MEQSYSVYSEFDLQKHKRTYINYLEVLILEDGTVKYAVPSHQGLAENLCMEKLNITRQELYCMTLNHLCDYMEWLLTQTNTIAVWNEGCITGYNGANSKQIATLKRLKMNGLYKGAIPIRQRQEIFEY